MSAEKLIAWLLAGDVSLQYQVQRDLLGVDDPALQARIPHEGWGACFLAASRPDGHWGRGFYQPKWISSHYTLLDLKYLGLPPDNAQARATVALILAGCKSEDGGINPARSITESDVCVNGMFLNYACYFGAEPAGLHSVVDFICRQHMPDGGWNCRFNREGARHSSLHSTISLLEGIHEYARRGYTYRRDDLGRMAAAGREFILQHQLYKSDRTGAIIDRRMLLLSFPARWYYDILRALVYLVDAGQPYDPRMDAAMAVLKAKQRRDGAWPVQNRHPGETHFEMEKTGGPSRWNTLRALRVQRWFGDGGEG